MYFVIFFDKTTRLGTADHSVFVSGSMYLLLHLGCCKIYKLFLHLGCSHLDGLFQETGEIETQKKQVTEESEEQRKRCQNSRCSKN